MDPSILVHLKNEQSWEWKLKNFNTNDEISLYTCLIDLFSKKTKNKEKPTLLATPQFKKFPLSFFNSWSYKTRLLLRQVYASWHKLSSQYCLAIPSSPCYIHTSQYLPHSQDSLAQFLLSSGFMQEPLNAPQCEAYLGLSLSSPLPLSPCSLSWK